MDKSLLDYYQENLEYLRDQGRDFAREFPKIASRLEITENECADPYVERILEGTAFLASKVERELDESMPKMLESFWGNTMPVALDLIPSFSIAELKDLDRSSIPANPKLPAGSRFEIMMEGAKSPCTFSTMIPLSVQPVVLEDVRYLSLELEKYDLTASAGLYLKFQRLADIPIKEYPDDLLVYLDMPGEMASRLQQHLQTECTAIYSLADGRTQAVDGIRFTIPMLAEDGEPNWPETKASEQKALYQFAVFQSMFRFIRIHGFGRILKETTGETLELILTFRNRCSDFIHVIEKKSLRLNCIPVCNLFRKKSDRMLLGMKVQHHLVPDRTAPLDFEVSRVLNVSLFDNGNRTLLDLHRLFDADFTADGEDSFNFFSVQRVPRLRGDTEKRRSTYSGQEVFLSFSGEKYLEIQQNAVQFSAEMLCTNRDLPLFLRNGAALKAKDSGLFRSAVLLTSPTAPGAPLLSGFGKEYAEKAAFFLLHFSDMLWCDRTASGDMLQKIIHMHIPHNREELSGLERSVIAMESTKEVFRYVLRGQVFFESGWKVRLVLDELACTGIGYYTFGCVLREILRNYKPVNMPAKIILETKQQGVITEWMI
jgi:type VI secretion system VasI/ImpG family protein